MRAKTATRNLGASRLTIKLLEVPANGYTPADAEKLWLDMKAGLLKQARLSRYKVFKVNESRFREHPAFMMEYEGGSNMDTFHRDFYFDDGTGVFLLKGTATHSSASANSPEMSAFNSGWQHIQDSLVLEQPPVSSGR